MQVDEELVEPGDEDGRVLTGGPAPLNQHGIHGEDAVRERVRYRFDRVGARMLGRPLHDGLDLFRDRPHVLHAAVQTLDLEADAGQEVLPDAVLLSRHLRGDLGDVTNLEAHPRRLLASDGEAGAVRPRRHARTGQ